MIFGFHTNRCTRSWNENIMRSSCFVSSTKLYRIKMNTFWSCWINRACCSTMWSNFARSRHWVRVEIV